MAVAQQTSIFWRAKFNSRALEPNLAAAAGQLGRRALPGNGAGVLPGPRAGLGCWNGVQAVWKGVQIRLGGL